MCRPRARSLPHTHTHGAGIAEPPARPGTQTPQPRRPPLHSPLPSPPPKMQTPAAPPSLRRRNPANPLQRGPGGGCKKNLNSSAPRPPFRPLTPRLSITGGAAAQEVPPSPRHPIGPGRRRLASPLGGDHVHHPATVCNLTTAPRPPERRDWQPPVPDVPPSLNIHWPLPEAPPPVRRKGAAAIHRMSRPSIAPIGRGLRSRPPVPGRHVPPLLDVYWLPLRDPPTVR